MHPKGWLESRKEIAEYKGKTLYIVLPGDMYRWGPHITKAFYCHEGNIVPQTFEKLESPSVFIFNELRLNIRPDGEVPRTPKNGRVFTNFWRAYAFLLTHQG